MGTKDINDLIKRLNDEKAYIVKQNQPQFSNEVKKLKEAFKKVEHLYLSLSLSL